VLTSGRIVTLQKVSLAETSVQSLAPKLGPSN
jgi:hypothetical protein